MDTIDELEAAINKAYGEALQPDNQAEIIILDRMLDMISSAKKINAYVFATVLADFEALTKVDEMKQLKGLAKGTDEAMMKQINGEADSDE